MPQNSPLSGALQGLLHSPQRDLATTKRLREEVHPGNPAMQQALVPDDRYWQGRGMAEQSPLAGLGALLGSVPYDLSKLAYFHGPQPVRQGLEGLTAKLFPGEGFNPRTTSRPSLAGSLALIQGLVDGTAGVPVQLPAANGGGLLQARPNTRLRK